MEYLKPGEVLKNMTNKEDICEAQQVPSLQSRYYHKISTNIYFDVGYLSIYSLQHYR